MEGFYQFLLVNAIIGIKLNKVASKKIKETKAIKIGDGGGVFVGIDGTEPGKISNN
jgi:hypothetical protein